MKRKTSIVGFLALLGGVLLGLILLPTYAVYRQERLNPETIRILLECGCDPNGVLKGDGSWRTPLMLAVQADDLATVKALLEYGARTEWGVDRFQEVPLCAAIEQRSGEMVQEMLRHRADPNVETARTTPLISAVSRHDAALVRQLLGMGAEVDSYASLTGSALYVAAANGDVEIVRVLLEHGADAEEGHISWGQEYHPLDAAYPEKGAPDTPQRLAILNLLMAHGASLNPPHRAYAKADYGQNALVECAGEGDPVMVRWLLQHGVSPNAVYWSTDEDEMGYPTGPNGSTALQAARKGGHADVVALLRKAGAKK